MTPDLTHLPPDVPTDPPPDPRGAKFIAGSSQRVADWLRDYLGIATPNDVHSVTIRLTVGEAATADVRMFLRSGALAEMPDGLVGTLNVEPTSEQVTAAAWALAQAGVLNAPLQSDERYELARSMLKAATPGPNGPQRP